jgi:pectin methylesterase-like acyl-CoA thioesterase
VGHGWNPGVAAPRVLVVPTAYPMIQAAVDAARPGDLVRVRRGVYREQVSVSKDLSIRGAGARATTVRAPRHLRADADGATAIVEIRDGARVSI